MISRRMFAQLPIALGAASAMPAAATEPGKPCIAMLVYPGMIMLDLVGPLTVFNLLGAKPLLVWTEQTPVMTDVGLPIMPTASPEECPADLDILFVPGGLEGTVAAMGNPAVIEFLADRGSRAQLVTSVCTGALLLGAAGLLRGYSATSHWYVRDLLSNLGATPVHDRVVIDRNRVTAGGVTAGIDFGLTLAAGIAGEDMARQYQLTIEYDPKPPFDAGSPESAGPALTEAVLTRRSAALQKACRAVEAAARQLNI